MSSWGSFPSIFQAGHRAVRDLFEQELNIEEKVDGSQFSFGLVEASPADIEYPTIGGFSLKIRSKGCVMHIDAPEKMFNAAAETVKRLGPQLRVGWTYRGEFLAKPKHNALVYDRVPVGNIILFDINTGDQEYLSYEDKVIEAERLGLECVPRLYQGRIESIDRFREFLTTTSVLGGQLIEGVVIKPTNYSLFGIDKKVLMAKFVSEAFKEVHRKAWGESNPSGKDITQKIIETFRSPASWNKAIQHLREAGQLQEDVKDIGLIIREVPTDVLKENEEEIRDMLFKHYWPQIRRGITAGLPEWYKDQLLRLSFEREGTTNSVDGGDDGRTGGCSSADDNNSSGPEVVSS